MENSTYFANETVDKIGGKIMEKVESYYQALDSTGLLETINASIRCYYGGSYNSTGGSTKYVSRGGKYGQTRKMRVNHVRNLALHILQLATSQRPAPQPVAAAGASDSKTQAAVVVAKGIIDYYSRYKRVDRLLRSACERAIITGEAFIDVNWDSSLGKPEGMDGQKTINEGDLDFAVMSTLECVRDVTPGTGGLGDWVCLIKPANRYDLIAKYATVANPDELPEESAGRIKEIEEAILTAPKIATEGRWRERRPWGAVMSLTVTASDDTIAVFEFRHNKTPAVPQGRLIKMTEGGDVFLDSSLPFDDLNVRRLSASDMIDTPFGYAPTFDLLGIQEVVDALYSAVASNQMTFATQLIWALKSADFDYRQLSQGITLLEGNDPNAKPEPLNLTQTPAEVFNFIEQLEHVMETISGINATVRGNPEYSLKSGTALATIQASAIQFASTLQESYAHLVEDTYTDMLRLLQKHADNPRQIVIIGKFNKPYIQDFKSSDIAGIDRVVIDAGPAVANTIAFRQEVARDLIQNGMIKRPEEYIAVISTGRIEPLIEGEQAELILIQSENEYLKEGKEVHALPIDKHLLHIQEHRCAVADPEARMDPVRVQAISDHVMEHVQFLTDPAFAPLMALLGETSLASQMMTQDPGATAKGTNPAEVGNPDGNPNEPSNKEPSPAQPAEPAEQQDPNAGNVP